MSSQESWKNLFSLVPHEIKTPTSIIKGYAELIKSQTLNNEKIQFKVDNILYAVNQLEYSLNRWLLYAELIENSDKRIGMRGTMDFENVFFDILNENYTDVSFDLDIDISGVFKGYSEEFKMIFNEIIENSVKNCANKISIRLRSHEKFIEFRISDDGDGFSCSRNLIDPFVQTKDPLVRNEKGLGLGLSIAKILLQKYDGFLLIENDNSNNKTVVSGFFECL